MPHESCTELSSYEKQRKERAFRKNMSQNNANPSARQYGFSNAIFSSSPVVFNKENKPPTKTADSVATNSDSNVNSASSSCKRKLINYLPQNKLDNQNTKNVAPKTTKTRKNSTATLLRSQSEIMLENQDQQTLSLSKYHSEEKLKVINKNASNPRLSGDKTPVTHFCTPKTVANSRSASSSKSKPVKRYFSDNALPQTPDCYSAVHLETPRAKNDNGIEEQTVYEGESSNLTVGIRVRPLSFKEQNEPKISSIVEVTSQNVIVDCDTSQHTFMYDHCFISYNDPLTTGHASQETVFNNIALPLVQNAFEGYNVCLFAYGQTGSGKSYSMMGAEPAQSNSVEINLDAGIIPRFCHEIFKQISLDNKNSFTVEISYFEIYNEKIHDLLMSNNSSAKRAPLKVREHPIFGPYVVDLSQHSVQSYEDLRAWLKVGNSQRATAATGMNEKSSRSHSIFSIILTQTQSKKSPSIKSEDASRRSKINLVDLAGSERLSNTCVSGDKLREGVYINKSLLTLGKVIASLAESTSDRKRSFVPYRESVLTWLLKESLGGNSRTAMLGTISPANIHLEETLATLRYACQARAIVNRVRINEDPNQLLFIYSRSIRQLKAEIQRLKNKDGSEKQLGLTPRKLLDTIDSSSENSEKVLTKQKEIDELRDQLKKMDEQQKLWEKKRLLEAQEKKDTELAYLRRCGIAVELDFRETPKQPCLINLAADPMLSGTLLYLIPPGRVRIGRAPRPGTPSKPVDIMLDGPLIKKLHCVIENNHGKLTFYPEKDTENFVNGKLVHCKIKLKHGDRLVIGGNHYFKVCNPQNDQDVDQMTVQPIDFDFAYQEVLRVQEEKLRAELEESKQKAMKELENAKREIEMQLDSQKSAYECEIKKLGSNLEEHKVALEETNRKKKELELEKELLAGEIEANNKIRRLEIEDSGKNLSPYKSNFLQELEEILSETTADVETALTVKTSMDAMKTGGISLHEIQLLVREATERCRDVGVNYEFHQQQVVKGKGLQPVIRVRDKDNKVESLWEPLRFLDWMHLLRDHELEHSIRELQDSDDKWEPFEDSDIIEQDSLYSSRISVNITPVKKQLNESVSQFSVEASFLDGSMVDHSNESILQKRRDDIRQCLIQMEVASKTLKGLCNQYESKEVSGKISHNLDKINSITQNLKEILEEKSASKNISEISNISRSDTVIENSEIDKTTELLVTEKKYFHDGTASPAKSNLRNACPFLKNDNTSRSKNKQQLQEAAQS